MYEQIELFPDQKQEENSYCRDDDINAVYGMLVSLAEERGLEISGDEFSIWPHVPQYGYRLWMGMEVTKAVLADGVFAERVREITEYAKARDVELSCMTGACFFFAGHDTATLTFCTTFMDRERRKRRDLEK